MTALVHIAKGNVIKSSPRQLLVVYIREDRTEPISDDELKTALNLFMGYYGQPIDLINQLSEKIDKAVELITKREEN